MGGVGGARGWGAGSPLSLSLSLLAPALLFTPPFVGGGGGLEAGGRQLGGELAEAEVGDPVLLRRAVAQLRVRVVEEAGLARGMEGLIKIIISTITINYHYD